MSPTDERPGSRRSSPIRRRQPRTTPQPGDGPGAGRRRRLRVDRVARAASALGNRRPGDRRLLACTTTVAVTGVRRAPGLELGTAAGALAPVRQRRRWVRVPARVRAVDHRTVRRSAALAIEGQTTGAGWPPGRLPAPLIGLIREQVHGRVTIDEAGNAVGHYPVTDEVDIRNIRAGVEQLIRIHEARRADRRARAVRWRLAPRRDLDAFVADVTSQPIAPRGAHLLRAQMGSAGWERSRARSPARAASCTTRPGSGSAARAPSRARRTSPDADDHGAGATDRAQIVTAG